ncbi:MAG: alpha-hydroxy acid oxidase [Microthrixaceae bacterium]
MGDWSKLAATAVSAYDRATATSRRHRLAQLHSLSDVRDAARRALPPMVFDFVDGGAEDESTVRGNRDSFGRWWFVPRILTDVEHRSQQTELLGVTRRSPLVLSPAGLVGLAWPHGEAAAATAAGEFGVPFAVSSMSSVSVEDVRAASAEALWIQIYLWRDRNATEALVERSAQLGYETLCLTVDVPVTGQRERDLRNGMTIPPRIGVRNSLGVISRPGWALRVGAAGVTFANIEQDASSRDTMRLGAYVNEQLNPTATWDDLRWLRQAWPGKLVVKGVCEPGAAKRLVDEGVDGVIVSNHGGRQLDGAIPAIRALPGVVAAVGDQVDVLLDGGVRRGSDVIKAVALGATACMFGRPYVFGLAAGGQAGVTRVLELMESEIDRNLALLGVDSLDELRGNSDEFLVEAD